MSILLVVIAGAGLTDGRFVLFCSTKEMLHILNRRIMFCFGLWYVLRCTSLEKHVQMAIDRRSAQTKSRPSRLLTSMFHQ